MMSIQFFWPETSTPTMSTATRSMNATMSEGHARRRQTFTESRVPMIMSTTPMAAKSNCRCARVYADPCSLIESTEEALNTMSRPRPRRARVAPTSR